MNIEQQWEEAVEEFSNRAFERFTIEKIMHYDVFDNEDIDRCFKCDCQSALKIKPLSELFEHDVLVYGDDAYLMYKIFLFGKHMFSDAKDNREVLWHFVSSSHDFNCFDYEKSNLQRKTSAALPFDLSRAMAGDVVEYYVDDDLWRSCKFVAIHGIVAHVQDSVNVHTTVDNLRMKYPPKLTKYQKT